MTYRSVVADCIKNWRRDWARWLIIQPNRRLIPFAAKVDGSEALVSGDYVIEQILDSIREKIPVVLTGPRGCGKTWCVIEAVRRAVENGFVFGNPDKKESWGYVMAQGNKEVPREYLMEDEARIGGTNLNISLVRKVAPLIRFSTRDETTGDPIINEDGSLRTDETLPFVLFLDEVNRFSDGVLDSLLLLLEERQIVRNGTPITVNCAVVMTMNPPGYDGTAKRLSPPLQARLGRVIPLCTPDFTTTYDISTKSAAPSSASDVLAVKRACLVSIALWGLVDAGSAAFRYLTPQSRELLNSMAKDPAFAQPMQLLGRECSYGPDVRGVKYWVKAAKARRDALMSASAKRGPNVPQTRLESALMYCFDTSMLHRISTRFVETSSSAKLGQVENAARVICDNILDLPATSPWLRTVYDEIGATQLKVIQDQWGPTPEELRQSWHASGRSSDADLVVFARALSAGDDALPASQATVLSALKEGAWIGDSGSSVNQVRRPELMVLINRMERKFRKVGASALPSMIAQARTFGYAQSLFANADEVESTLEAYYFEAVGLAGEFVSSEKSGWPNVALSGLIYFVMEELNISRVSMLHDETKSAFDFRKQEAFKARLADEVVQCNRRLQDWVARTATNDVPSPLAGTRDSLGADSGNGEARTRAIDGLLHAVVSTLVPKRIGQAEISAKDLTELIDRLAQVISPSPAAVDEH